MDYFHSASALQEAFIAVLLYNSKYSSLSPLG
jgi:hypothetical protein